MSAKHRHRSKRSGRRTRYEGRDDQCGATPPKKWGARTAPCALKKGHSQRRHQAANGHHWDAR